MSDTAPQEDTLESTRRRHHPRCFVSRPPDQFGLGVLFRVLADGCVEATVVCPPSWEGYPGLAHGGIVASVLDGAMTNALFARGVVAVTAEVKIRYWRPLRLGTSATIVGQVTRREPPLYLAEARIASDEGVYATCSGKFMVLPDGLPGD